MFSILYIKPVNNDVRIFYENHATYHEGDAWLDIFIPNEMTIHPGEDVRIDLGISCEMIEESLPDVETIKKLCNYEDFKTNIGTFLLFKNLIFSKKNVSYYLYPRSSISNTPLIMTNSVGIIDSKYTGTLKISLKNVGFNPYTIKRGDKLVQIYSGN